MLCAVCRVLCAVCCVPCAVCCVLCAVCCVLCAVCCVLCAVCCVLCAVRYVLCAVRCALCAVCRVPCAVCCVRLYYMRIRINTALLSFFLSFFLRYGAVPRRPTCEATFGRSSGVRRTTSPSSRQIWTTGEAKGERVKPFNNKSNE